MANDYETLKAEMEKAYSGYKFLDAEVKYNGVTAAFYIYAHLSGSLRSVCGEEVVILEHILRLLWPSL